MKAITRAAYEVEAEGLEEFLELVGRRMQDPHALEDPLPRRCVAVADLFDRKGTQMGVPLVKRYVRASFIWGDDLITLELVSSHNYEHPDPEEARKVEERQTQLAERVRGAITDRIADAGLAAEFPLVKGFLHPASDPRTR